MKTLEIGLAGNTVLGQAVCQASMAMGLHDTSESTSMFLRKCLINSSMLLTENKNAGKVTLKFFAFNGLCYVIYTKKTKVVANRTLFQSWLIFFY